MPVIDKKIEDRYAAYNADTMEVLPEIEDGSVGFSVYSPPFPELYQYSNDPRDMSNCTRYDEGIEQFKFVVNQMYRVTNPGRMTAVHCMDLKKGSYFQRDFPGDIVRVHEEYGFHFFCRITIWKDPWLIARRTRVRSLQHKSIVTGKFKVRVAGPDYVLVFIKGGEDENPIEHPTGLMRYAGGNPVPATFTDSNGRVREANEFYNYKGDQRKNLLSHWIWRNYASPVWTDIRSGRLMPYEESKEVEEEKHVCALQLDVIERCLTLWSNPNDIVLTPFMGVGSEVCGALVNNRRAIGIELKQSYYRQALKNIDKVLAEGWGQEDGMLEYETSEEVSEEEVEA